MLHWLSCHVFRAHDYAVKCDTTGVFLQCEECGHRSAGWQTGATEVLRTPAVHAPLDTPLARLRSRLVELGVLGTAHRV